MRQSMMRLMAARIAATPVSACAREREGGIGRVKRASINRDRAKTEHKIFVSFPRQKSSPRAAVEILRKHLILWIIGRRVLT